MESQVRPMSRPLTPANEPPKAAAPDPQTFIRALAAYLAKPVGGAATPNRVNQLDALEIDGQILHSLWESLGEVFHGHLQGVSLRLQAELRAALRFLYFYWSVWQDRPSPGNTYQNLRYTSADGASMVSPELLPPLSRMQKLITGVVYVGLRYMSERLDRSDEFLLRYATARRAMAFTESLVRLADALNYVLFLYDGRYRSPLDRMLGMQLCYQRDGAGSRTFCSSCCRCWSRGRCKSSNEFGPPLSAVTRDRWAASMTPSRPQQRALRAEATSPSCRTAQSHAATLSVTPAYR
eukprot:ctg_467.g112